MTERRLRRRLYCSTAERYDERRLPNRLAVCRPTSAPEDGEGRGPLVRHFRPDAQIRRLLARRRFAFPVAESGADLLGDAGEDHFLQVVDVARVDGDPAGRGNSGASTVGTHEPPGATPEQRTRPCVPTQYKLGGDELSNTRPKRLIVPTADAYGVESCVLLHPVVGHTKMSNPSSYANTVPTGATAMAASEVTPVASSFGALHVPPDAVAPRMMPPAVSTAATLPPPTAPSPSVPLTVIHAVLEDVVVPESSVENVTRFSTGLDSV